MEFTIRITTEHVRNVLAGLDELKHSVSRPTFDIIYAQVQQQELAAQQQEAAPPVNEAPGLSD